MARSLGGRGPSRPGEERRELVDLLRVGDHPRDQPILGGVLPEELGVVTRQLGERADLTLGEGQHPRARVIAVGPEHLDDRRLRVGRAGGDLPRLLEVGRAAQVVGGEVRTQVGAVAQDRAVLHQTPGLKQLLALRDVLTAEHRVPRGAHDLHRLGHRVRVGAIGQDPHHEEPEQHDQGHGLDPALADEHGALRRHPSGVRSGRDASGHRNSLRVDERAMSNMQTLVRAGTISGAHRQALLNLAMTTSAVAPDWPGSC